MKWLFIIPFLFSSVSFSQNIVNFKNKDFHHGKILKKTHGGALEIIDYDEMRDVNGRDEIPVKKAKENRVHQLPIKSEKSTRIAGVPVYTAGDYKTASFAVVFIHGAGGNRSLGFNDWSFGGNFNRLKNLAVRSGGAYLSPSAQLSRNGALRIGKMLNQAFNKKRNTKIILACGSQGGLICWELAKSKKYSHLIDGLVFLGTARAMPKGLLPYVDGFKPIVFAHGSRDGVLPWTVLESDLLELKSFSSNYPVKYFLFRNGGHGTPIRMIDWRRVLIWIFKS